MRLPDDPPAGPRATVLGLIAFAYLFARLLSVNDITPLLRNHRFAWDSFLLAVSLSASWQIAFGPYVADYSRYLPSGVSPLRTFYAWAAARYWARRSR